MIRWVRQGVNRLPIGLDALGAHQAGAARTAAEIAGVLGVDRGGCARLLRGYRAYLASVARSA